MVGVVVSNPIPMKTTDLPRLLFAISRASVVEYTVRTSAPSALALCRLERLPGTLSISPKVVIITPGICDRAIALSRSLLAVTQTGQPGPDTISMVFGRTWRIPCLKIATVCPPQNSIKRTVLLDSR